VAYRNVVVRLLLNDKLRSWSVARELLMISAPYCTGIAHNA
jgi:hypothetical protein